MTIDEAIAKLQEEFPGPGEWIIRMCRHYDCGWSIEVVCIPEPNQSGGPDQSCSFYGAGFDTAAEALACGDSDEAELAYQLTRIVEAIADNLRAGRASKRTADR